MAGSGTGQTDYPYDQGRALAARMRPGEHRAQVPCQEEGGLHPTATLVEGEDEPALAGAADARLPDRRAGMDRDVLRQRPEAAYLGAQPVEPCDRIRADRLRRHARHQVALAPAS